MVYVDGKDLHLAALFNSCDAIICQKQLKTTKNYNIYLQRKVFWLLIANPVGSELIWIMKATRICVWEFCIMWSWMINLSTHFFLFSSLWGCSDFNQLDCCFVKISMLNGVLVSYFVLKVSPARLFPYEISNDHENTLRRGISAGGSTHKYKYSRFNAFHYT